MPSMESILITTGFESRKFEVDWKISNFNEYGLENGECLTSPTMKMRINETEFLLKVYPYGESQDDKDFISVHCHILSDNPLIHKDGKIKVSLFDGEVPLMEMERNMTDEIECIGFDKIVYNHNRINELMITCEIFGDFLVHRVEYLDGDSKDYELNVPSSPLR